MRKMKVTAPTSGPTKADVGLPSSKSISNRLLIMRALAGGDIENLSNAADTVLLEKNLSERPKTMSCGLGGTSLRFLLAWAAIQDGEEYLIGGEKTLLARPHDALMDALLLLGANIKKTDKGFKVKGCKLKGGEIELTDLISSQFVSALLLIAPYMKDGLALQWSGKRLSESYVKMTKALMKEHGADVKVRKDVIHVAPKPYETIRATVNSDWSAASFWYSLALGREREFLLKGLEADNLQGDQAIKDILKPFVSSRKSKGAMKIASIKAPFSELEFNLKDTPDLFQPLALSMACMGIASTFEGLDTLIVKESDRIDSVGKTLQALGANVFWTDNSFHLGSAKLNYNGTPLPTFNDHRMAMALVKLSDVFPHVIIEDPDVVEKSYPDFWVELMKAGYKLETID